MPHRGSVTGDPVMGTVPLPAIAGAQSQLDADLMAVKLHIIFNAITAIRLDFGVRVNAVALESFTNAVSYLLQSLTHWYLEDSWGSLNPVAREYSFYSLPHSLHVRLDRFLCHPTIQLNVTSAEYFGKTISDYNPLLWQIECGDPIPPAPT
ncbi:hypothetical protein NDU88_004905 [Pleurodeles waltl]|uniref:Uncharacterized protein n=1 Tax=Pleurodeles waltl TaxID=8319 RepID=A0AAV7W9I9_PLEWA|nr:hypothetical protein NDU88_004905 [Pleurodeles waltl]